MVYADESRGRGYPLYQEIFMYKSKLVWETKETKHMSTTIRRELAVLIYYLYF